MNFFEVAVANKNARKTYTYKSELNLSNNEIVEIEFGKKKCKGIIIKKAEAIENLSKLEKTKTIIQTFKFITPDNFFEFITWVSEYNLVSMGSVLEISIPNACFKKEPLAMVYEVDGKIFSLDEFKGKKSTTIKKEKESINLIKEDEIQEKIKLSEDQISAIKKIQENKKTLLLQGITGSGKTIVALESLKGLKGKKLIIAPEISLTSSWARAIEKNFKQKAFYFHNKMNDLYKSSLFKWINSDEDGFIVGARSALFLPYKNLSAIVLDEEHSSALKQETYPRYHARDMAVLRGHIEKVKVILISATPSLETVYNIKEKKYEHAKLSRTPKSGVPSFEIVKQEKLNILAPKIIEEVEKAIQKNEQVLFFLNRKGYSPYSICSVCWKSLMCFGCEVPYVFYSQGYLMCNKCEKKAEIPSVCPSCKQNTIWKKYGIGIEKLEDYLRQLFPKYKFKSISSDTKEILEYLEELNENKINGLIATQVLAQGHDFKNISLAVAIDADMGLNSPDFRAKEKIYQLWQQIKGRSGRHNTQGKMILQTNHDQNRFISLLKSENPVEKLLDERKEENWPPYSRCAAIIVRSRNKVKVEMDLFHSQEIKALKNNTNPNFEIYGPLFICKNKYIYEWRFLIKAPKNQAINEIVKNIMKDLPKLRDIEIEAEIDPYSFN